MNGTCDFTISLVYIKVTMIAVYVYKCASVSGKNRDKVKESEMIILTMHQSLHHCIFICMSTNYRYSTHFNG